MSSKKFIARRRPWKPLRVDAELYEKLRIKGQQEGWLFDMTKFIHKILSEYAGGKLSHSEVPQVHRTAPVVGMSIESDDQSRFEVREGKEDRPATERRARRHT